jgi:hypothetical protein
MKHKNRYSPPAAPNASLNPGARKAAKLRKAGIDPFSGERILSTSAIVTYNTMLDMLSPADRARHEQADVNGKQVLWDKTGVGHDYVLADADSMPENIRDEIAAEIIDGKVDICEDYVASNGQHYRWE